MLTKLQNPFLFLRSEVEHQLCKEILILSRADCLKHGIIDKGRGQMTKYLTHYIRQSRQEKTP